MSSSTICPHCGGTSVFAAKRGIHIGKAIICLPLGLAGRNDILITCLDCGQVFRPGGRPLHDKAPDSQLAGCILLVVIVVFGIIYNNMH
jgi:hypothetical protein